MRPSAALENTANAALKGKAQSMVKRILHYTFHPRKNWFLRWLLSALKTCLLSILLAWLYFSITVSLGFGVAKLPSQNYDTQSAEENFEL